MERILWLFSETTPGNKKWQKFVRAGVQSNKRKMREQHTRGLAQKEEQLLGVSSHYSTKQPLRTHTLRHVPLNYTLAICLGWCTWVLQTNSS